MEGLIDTRDEYIEHIQDILSVAISKRIYAIYTEIMEEKKGLKGFQNELYSIRKWNNNIVSDEYKKIVKYTKCKYLANLIKIIIITTIKIKIYEYREQFDNIKIKIPNAEDFVHKCYINAAAFSWKNAYLYNRNNIKDAEYQNNLNIIEENIRAIVKKTFRDFIPFDEIFKQIEDNLSDNVHQYRDTDAQSVDVEITKKPKDTKTKHITKDNASDEEEEDDVEDDEEDEEEDDEEDEEEDDEEDDEDEEEDDEDDEEDEEDDEDDEEEKNEEDEKGETGETEDKKGDIEKIESKDVEATCIATQYDDIKLNNIVDTKYSDDNKDEADEARDLQEISFAPHVQDKEDEAILANSIHKEWNDIKDKYSSLSQNKTEYNTEYNTAYKTFDKEGGRKKKYDHYDDDDSISVVSHASVATAITDISQIKQIHIQDTAKSKKPSFF